MLRRPILILLVLAACGEAPLDPGPPPVSARAINLSGLPGEVAIWMDGQMIAPGLVDTQPSLPLSITPGAHTFGYSPAGASAPELTTELTVSEESVSLITLMRGPVEPELRVVTYPPARDGRITIRALNVSADTARLIVRTLTGGPGGAVITLDLEPGAFGQTDVSGTTTVRVGLGQQESPTIFSLQTGRPSDPPEEFNGFGFHQIGFPVSGEVRTVIFHRSPVFLPDVYSF